MASRASLLLVGAATAMLLSAGTMPAAGQSLWIPRDGEQAAMVEVLGPSVEGMDQSFFSSAYFLSGRIAVTPNLALVGELPYSRFKATFEGTDVNGYRITVEESGSTMGNVYLGVEGSPSDSPIFGEFGIRLPVVDEDESDASALGLLADLTRWEAFLPKAVFFQGAFNLREVTGSSIEYRLRLSPVLLISTDSDFYDDPELFATYAWAVGYHGRMVRVGTALSGRILLTEDFGNLGQRSRNQLELHADIGPWSVRPGFDLHLPLDSWGRNVPVVVGASVSWRR